MRNIASLALTFVLGLTTAAQADEVADFYKGKQIQLVIGYGAGGGYDLNARMLARYLSPYIPGNPTVVPQNMPGAGSLRAANYVLTVAPKDGTVIGAVDRQVSLGDFVISGGELAAMALIDAVVRQLPGVLNDAQSAEQDTFSDGLLECPQYTRPEQYAGSEVPAVLMSGHHANIVRWRLKQSLGRTAQRRPELLQQRGMNAMERGLLEEFLQEQAQDGKR